MIPADDKLGRRNEIKDCIAAANVADAVRRLIDFVRDFQPVMEDEAVMISMDYTDLEEEMRLDILKRREVKRSKRQIVLRILTTLNDAFSKQQRA